MPHCGHPRELSDQVRPQYANLGGIRGGPDQLFADRRARREQTQAQRQAVSAAERQADALERQVAAQERANELREIELGLRNGHDPRPNPSRTSPHGHARGQGPLTVGGVRVGRGECPTRRDVV